MRPDKRGTDMVGVTSGGYQGRVRIIPFRLKLYTSRVFVDEPGGAQDYNRAMARGWESKSVEAQIEDSSSDPSTNQEHNISPDERQALIRRSDLILSRKRVVQQLEGSTNERYSEFLRQSLAAIESQIEDLN
jgi:hypothetical protein